MKHHALMRMIKEAGGGQSRHPEKWDVWEFNDAAVERFAKLVAEAEREACADIENKLHLITEDAHRTYSSRELFDHKTQAIKDYAALIRARGAE